MKASVNGSGRRSRCSRRRYSSRSGRCTMSMWPVLVHREGSIGCSLNIRIHDEECQKVSATWLLRILGMIARSGNQNFFPRVCFHSEIHRFIMFRNSWVKQTNCGWFERTEPRTVADFGSRKLILSDEILMLMKLKLFSYYWWMHESVDDEDRLFFCE